MYMNIIITNSARRTRYYRYVQKFCFPSFTVRHYGVAEGKEITPKDTRGACVRITYYRSERADFTTVACIPWHTKAKKHEWQQERIFIISIINITINSFIAIIYPLEKKVEKIEDRRSENSTTKQRA